jgi:hypothetical protein
MAGELPLSQHLNREMGSTAKQGPLALQASAILVDIREVLEERTATGVRVVLAGMLAAAAVFQVARQVGSSSRAALADPSLI